MRAAGAMMLCGALAGCGDSDKQQAAYAEAAKHFTPPAVMSRLEYGGIVERRFRALDRNGDLYVTRDELPDPESRLVALDTDGDGRISADEWSKGMLARFDGDDLNHDGSVTSAEHESARQARTRGPAPPPGG